MFDKMEIPRDQEIITVEVSCYCPEELLGDWTYLSKEARDFWSKTTFGTPCDGTGITGLYCEGCYFGGHEIV